MYGRTVGIIYCRTVGVIYKVMCLINAGCRFQCFVLLVILFSFPQTEMCSIVLSLKLQARSYSYQLLGTSEHTVST